MHSNNIVQTLDTGQNRFTLCHQAFKVARQQLQAASRNQTAAEDATNDALRRLSGAARFHHVLNNLEAPGEAAAATFPEQEVGVLPTASPLAVLLPEELLAPPVAPSAVL
jgi:hypothetical protein